MNLRPKNDHELELMRQGGQRLSNILEKVNDFVAPGQSLKEIDTYIHKLILQAEGKPSFLGYHNYPAASCLSVNDVVVHGIPTDYILKDGDVLSVDVGLLYEGYHTDAAFTRAFGRISQPAQHLLEVTQESLRRGIEAAIVGNTIDDIGSSVEQYVNSQGKFGIVRDLTGHGIGSNLQESPEIPNYHTQTSNQQLINHLTLAIEPMITLGTWQVVIGDDNWTVFTQDGSLAAHFETTVAIFDNDPQVLVPFPLSPISRFKGVDA